MKKLLAIAIGVLFAGATSSWALLGMEKVSYDGSLEVKGISANNEVDRSDKETESDHRGETNTRARLGINAELTEGVMGRLEFGRTNSTYGQNYSGTANASNSIDDETANILINNAYVEMANLLSLNVRLGRQYAGNANDLVWFIGPRQTDSMNINAIDGILIGKKWEMIDANLFMGKAVKNDAQGNTDQDLSNNATGDVNVNNLDIVISKVVPGAKINLGYVWGVQTSTSPSNALQTWRVGITGDVMESMFTYKAEFLQNAGEDKIPNGSKLKYEGSAIDLGAGFNSAETKAGKFAANIGYMAASGDDKTTDNKDKAFHDFSVLGVASSDRYYGEIFSKSNNYENSFTKIGANSDQQGVGLKVLNLGLAWMPAMVKNTTVKVDYFNYTASEDGSQSADPNAGDIGTEWNATIGYKMSDNVNILGGYAMLDPDKGIVGTGAGARKDDITKWFANASFKWGSAAE